MKGHWKDIEKFVLYFQFIIISAMLGIIFFYKELEYIRCCMKNHHINLFWVRSYVWEMTLMTVGSLMLNHSEIMDNSWFVHFVVVFLPLKNKWGFRVDKRGTKSWLLKNLNCAWNYTICKAWVLVTFLYLDIKELLSVLYFSNQYFVQLSDFFGFSLRCKQNNMSIKSPIKINFIIKIIFFYVD